MWIHIALVLFAPAVFTESYYESLDDTYHYQAAGPEDMLDSNQEVDPPRARRFENSFNPAAKTMAPEGAEAIQGAINQFLGRNQPDYVAPTSPTRTPKPDQSPIHVFTNITSAQNPGQEHIAFTTSTSTLMSGEKFHEHTKTTTVTSHSQKTLERTATDPTRIAVSQEFQNHMTVAYPSRALKPGEKIPGYIVPGRSQEGEASDSTSVFGHYAIPTWTLYALTPGRDSATRTRPRNSSTQLQGQRVDYANLFEAKKMPLRTQIAMVQTNPSRTISGQKFHLYTSPSRSPKSGQEISKYIPRASSEPELRGPFPVATVPQALRILTTKYTRRTRTTPTTTTPKTTRNTLCTHGPHYCKTMCFDEDKYRVSCVTNATLPSLDMVKLFSMLDVLLQDYDTNNLTERYNNSLKKSYGTCQPSSPPSTTATTTTPPPPVLYYEYDTTNDTGKIISKCFVCGLEVGGIPESAHCSDAFAGEFLPLTPVDASARGHLAEYRKYCKYMDMLHWYINGSDARTIWGAWTGGCAVRWLDLSGVYTQRTCRNRHHPATGRHFASKRMASLEFALGAVDNGCIISPMASLVPFSRGVSLYARFHACVCTGNWCNRAITPRCGSLVIAPLVFTIFL